MLKEKAVLKTSCIQCGFFFCYTYLEPKHKSMKNINFFLKTFVK